MGFVSIDTLVKRNVTALSIYYYGAARISAGLHRTDTKHSTISVEVDFPERKLRVKLSETGSRKLSNDGTSFSMPQPVCRDIIPTQMGKVKIPLSEGEGGWWYGSF